MTASTIAISTLGPSLEERVDERFGRAMYFAVVDSATDAVEFIDNSESRNALQGSGISSAELMSGKGVAAVITGHLGPKAFSALGAAGIKGYEGTGMSAAEALAAFRAGELKELTEAGEAHAG
ncbi:MAG: NifB/NifX family molybdenum-iron cluster-binding protein [Coriobacteriia bacterium]